MRNEKHVRLLHVLYRVALALVLAMLVLVPIAPIEFWPCLCIPGILILVLDRSKALFSKIHLTTFMLE